MTQAIDVLQKQQVHFWGQVCSPQPRGRRGDFGCEVAKPLICIKTAQDQTGCASTTEGWQTSICLNKLIEPWNIVYLRNWDWWHLSQIREKPGKKLVGQCFLSQCGNALLPDPLGGCITHSHVRLKLFILFILSDKTKLDQLCKSKRQVSCLKRDHKTIKYSQSVPRLISGPIHQRTVHDSQCYSRHLETPAGGEGPWHSHLN